MREGGKYFTSSPCLLSYRWFQMNFRLPALLPAFLRLCIFVSAPAISGTPLSDWIPGSVFVPGPPVRAVTLAPLSPGSCSGQPRWTAAEDASEWERLPSGCTSPAFRLCFAAVFVSTWSFFSESSVWQDVSASTGWWLMMLRDRLSQKSWFDYQ